MSWYSGCMRHLSPIFITLLIAPLAWADAITLDGERHEGVFIRESERMVYVHFPNDGRVEAVMRSELDEDAIELSEDASEREALEAAWKMARDANEIGKEVMAGARALPTPRAQLAHPGLEPVSEGETERPVTDGVVPRVDLRDVPLGTALSAMLRPMGLDYEVREGMVYISDPQSLRTESWEPLETRVYDIKNFDATLPKIVVMNPAGQRYPSTAPPAAMQGGFGPGFSR